MKNMDGSLVARIFQSFKNIVVTNDQGEVVFYVKPPLMGAMCKDCRKKVVFLVKTNGGELLGTITKYHGGLFQEVFSDARTFLIDFNPALDYHVKFIILCSLLLLVFANLYFTLRL